MVIVRPLANHDGDGDGDSDSDSDGDGDGDGDENAIKQNISREEKKLCTCV